MIVSMPPLRIFWPSNAAYELDHGTMDMPRGSQSIARSAAYPLSGTLPDGIAEVHVEHWTASTTSYTDVGTALIGGSDGSTNKDRAGFIAWLDGNATLAVQYAHRRVRRFASVDGKNASGQSVVPDASVKGDEIIAVKKDGATYATGLRRAVSGGSRIVWKLSADLVAGPTYEFVVEASAPSLTARAFLDNHPRDPGYLSTVAHAFYEDIADFPGGPGAGGGNVPSD